VKVLGLDISTKTGYAVIQDGVLISHGLKTADKVDLPGLCEDFTFVARARAMGEHVYKLLVQVQPDVIVIEQTNLGRSRTDQKLLEFTHFEVLRRILECEREYQVRYVDTSQWRSILQIKLSSEQRSHNRLVKAGAARGKVTPKHLAVAWANQTYGLELLKKDHDIADAIALATFGHKKGLPPEQPKFDLNQIIEPHKKVVV